MRIPDNANVIDSGYCNRDDWEATKRKQLDKYKEKIPRCKVCACAIRHKRLAYVGNVQYVF